YQEYRGLLGQVHRDLQQLDADLRAAHRQWDASPTPTPPLERIILYIDDLDRCPPQRVVEVLAAVHLMLALPLFVVVVAVDPRWLLSSLHHHDQELFTAAGPTGRPWDGEDLATPLDYLDKIFQIPFAVAPLSDTAASSYLSRLLRPNQPTATTITKPEQPERSHPASTAPVTRVPDASEPEPAEPTTKEHAVQHSPVADGDLRKDPIRSTPSSAAVVAGGPAIVPDLRPQGLQMSPEEIDFLARLGPLLPTPRAAKKLVNLYRLVRIGIPDANLPAFLAEHTHQPVQLLLALLVGTPNDARIILTAILAAEPADDLIKLVGAETASGVPNDDWTAT
ncbi:MAG: P-loop NTPase fold protein, partial [Pseudonocardiaceae bacterium]